MIEEHPHRAMLSAETHARPTLPLPAPCDVLHEAFLHGPGGAAAALAFVAELCGREGVAAPAPGSDLHIASLRDGATLKWERHGEFSTFTRVVAPDAALDAARWSPPGARIAAVRIAVRQSPARLDPRPAGEVAASSVAGGLAQVWSNLKPDGDGFTAMLVETDFTDVGRLTPGRLGRLARRLMEIECYRMLALLAFPLAREARHTIDALDRQVAGAFESPDADDKATLESLTDAARDAERLATRCDFRFGAAAAYRRLVMARLVELREERIEGQQRLSAFLARRFDPALDTVEATRARLESLSRRIERACALLRTRVELQVQQQNQALLRSMDDRAHLQLRLQETVEGLSVVAISYYAVMLAQKLVHGLGAGLLHRAGVSEAAVDAALVVVIVAASYLGLRAARKRLAGG